MDLQIRNDSVMRVEAIQPHTFRVRLGTDDRFPEPGLTRYGIVRTEWPAVACRQTESEETVTFEAAEAGLCVNKADGRLAFRDAGGAVLLESSSAPASGAGAGFDASFRLAPDERLFGLGDESRDRINKRGHKAMMWVTNLACYAPIPYLMSTRGWALFLNTTWRHFFDLGSDDPDVLRMWSKTGGDLDLYLIAGGDLPALLDRYTDLVGKPALLPRSGYGLTFIQNENIDAHAMLQDCLNFRRDGFPCDQMELEPNWMSKRYDFSTEKEWDDAKFHIPYWEKDQLYPDTFIGAARRMGFKLCLWLCCDYDLSLYEEYLATGAWPSRAAYDAYHKEYHAAWEDPNVGAAVRSDRITKEREPWFEHLKKFVDQGVTGFKMDGAHAVNEHPDRAWGNGMTDEEMHNLYQAIHAKQMQQGFREHTGRRGMIWSSGGYAGTARYVATWAGDTGIGPGELVSFLNHGLSGHSNTAADGVLTDLPNLHFSLLHAWAKLLSWPSWTHPSYLDPRMGEIARFYLGLRYRLLPYLYSLAHAAHRTGMPIVRAMPLMYPDDPKWDHAVRQYMLGDGLLLGAYSDEIELPEGPWINYWTGEEIRGPRRVVGGIPENRGGHLFVRGGAILPYGPVTAYAGERPLAALDLHVYPHGESRFRLYEDDGISYGFENGELATTDIACREEGREVRVEIGAREGSYEGMPAARSFHLAVRTGSRPVSVKVGDREIGEGDPPQGWRYGVGDGFVRLDVVEDADRKEPVRVRILSS